MQAHYDSTGTGPRRFYTYLNPGDGKPFAAVSIGVNLGLYIFSAQEADELMKAAAEAKRLLEPPCLSTAPETGRACTETGEHDRHRNGLVVWGGPAPGEGGVLFPAACDPDSAPELFIDGSPFCTARRGIPGQGGDLCELPLHHDGDHRAPGNDEGDPDVTWSDEAAAADLNLIIDAGGHIYDEPAEVTR